MHGAFFPASANLNWVLLQIAMAKYFAEFFPDAPDGIDWSYVYA